jgi:hypothetical protein
VGENQLDLRDRFERHVSYALRVAAFQVRAHGNCEPRLADAAGTGEGDQPHPGSFEQPRDLLDVTLAPDQ